MSVTLLVIIGLIVTLLLHFAGVYTKSVKIVWIAILFLWAVAIGTFTNEIKPEGYKEIKAMQGKYAETDALIKKAGEEVSFYELMQIKRNFLKNKRQEESQ